MATRIIASRTAGRALSRLMMQTPSAANRSLKGTLAHNRPFQPHTNVSSVYGRWFSDSNKQEEKQEEAEEPVETPAEAEEAPSEEESVEAEQPPNREQVLEAQVKDLKEQVLRSLADQENTRRIAKSDVSSARQFAIKSFAKSLLDVADNLDRALDAVPDELIQDKTKNPELATLYEGIQMTEKGLLKAFEANGLEKYGKAGDAFDPNLHEALLNYPDPNQPTDHVGQVMKPGYKLNNRVLRPAKVGVVKNP